MNAEERTCRRCGKPDEDGWYCGEHGHCRRCSLKTCNSFLVFEEKLPAYVRSHAMRADGQIYQVIGHVDGTMATEEDIEKARISAQHARSRLVALCDPDHGAHAENAELAHLINYLAALGQAARASR